MTEPLKAVSAKWQENTLHFRGVQWHTMGGLQSVNQLIVTGWTPPWWENRETWLAAGLFELGDEWPLALSTGSCYMDDVIMMSPIISLPPPSPSRGRRPREINCSLSLSLSLKLLSLSLSPSHWEKKREKSVNVLVRARVCVCVCVCVRERERERGE